MPATYEARLRHATYYLNILQEANRLFLQGGDRIGESRRIFESEWDNIQAGREWAENAGDRDDAAGKLCDLYPGVGAELLSLHLHPRERIRWLEAALAAARRYGKRKVEAHQLGGLALAHAAVGDTLRALRLYRDALALFQEIGERKGIAHALAGIGATYTAEGNLRAAITYFRQGLEIFRELGDRDGELRTLINL